MRISSKEAEMVCRIGHQTLCESARNYYLSRGVTEIQISTFGLGSTDSKSFGSSDSGQHDMLVLPLTNIIGTVLGFQIRPIRKGKAEYKDYLVTRIEPVLFGLGQAAKSMWETGEVCLVEGAFDLFPIQSVFPATVATITSYVSPQTLRLLRRLVSRIWVAYDNDEAGESGYKRIIGKGKEFQVDRFRFPQGVKDPGELREKLGPSGVITVLQQLNDPLKRKINHD